MSLATPRPFGHTPDGTPAVVYTFENANGTALSVTPYGGIITGLRVRDRDGRLDDVVLGHDSVEGYAASDSYFGAIVGRYANRIARGRFTLDGEEHVLATNNGPNHLHGGVRGFDKVTWEAEPFERAEGSGIALSYLSADGEEGYPGTVHVRVQYTLTPRDEVVVDYEATTDRATPLNLSQHTYFNLAGAGMRDVLDHELRIAASRYTPVDATLIPTGELAPVDGTPFDFRTPRRIGERIGARDVQLERAGGYDHNLVLDGWSDSSGTLLHAARLAEPGTGRVLDVHTTQPGVQFYSGNFLDGSAIGKQGRRYAHRTGLCLETQHFPDSPNQPAFPTTILRPGSRFRSRTVFAFSAT